MQERGEIKNIIKKFATIILLKVNFKNMKGLHMLTWILLVVGGLNWGLAVFGWDIQKLIIGGNGSIFFTILYLLIGISAIVENIYPQK